MSKYGLHGKLTATPGHGNKLADILLAAVQLVSTAKGCYLYLVSLDNADPEAVWITEVWENKTDHDDSLQVPGVKELIAQAMPLLQGRPEKGQELQILGGAGLAEK